MRYVLGKLHLLLWTFIYGFSIQAVARLVSKILGVGFELSLLFTISSFTAVALAQLHPLPESLKQK